MSSILNSVLSALLLLLSGCATDATFHVENAGPACGSDVAPVLVLRDETRDNLIELADEADAKADALRACQAYIREVVKPET